MSSARSPALRSVPRRRARSRPRLRGAPSRHGLRHRWPPRRRRSLQPLSFSRRRAGTSHPRGRPLRRGKRVRSRRPGERRGREPQALHRCSRHLPLRPPLRPPLLLGPRQRGVLPHRGRPSRPLLPPPRHGAPRHLRRRPRPRRLLRGAARPPAPSWGNSAPATPAASVPAPSWDSPAQAPGAPSADWGAPAPASWDAPAAGSPSAPPAGAPAWDVPKTEEPAAPAWSPPPDSPQLPTFPEPPVAAAPVAAPPPLQAPPPTPLPWEAPAAPPPHEAPAPVPDVAATMAAPGAAAAAAAAHEATALMPAWQPPAAAPAAPPETPALGGPTRPLRAVGGAGPQAELTIESGPDAGHTHRASDSALRMGRSPDNDLILRDPATSGHHARVERRGEQFWIVDLGSTNGTLGNGEPIQEKELNHGDRITVGQNAVHFSVLGG